MEEKFTKNKKWKYQKIMKEMEEIFQDISANYSQKLVYNLLNAIKFNNQREFFWEVLRVLNTKSKEAGKVADLCKDIGSLYPLSSSEFEKVAFSIILGIISAQGGEQNE